MTTITTTNLNLSSTSHLKCYIKIVLTSAPILLTEEVVSNLLKVISAQIANRKLILSRFKYTIQFVFIIEPIQKIIKKTVINVNETDLPMINEMKKLTSNFESALLNLGQGADTSIPLTKIIKDLYNKASHLKTNLYDKTFTLEKPQGNFDYATIIETVIDQVEHKNSLCILTPLPFKILSLTPSLKFVEDPDVVYVNTTCDELNTLCKEIKPTIKQEKKEPRKASKSKAKKLLTEEPVVIRPTINEIVIDPQLQELNKKLVAKNK